MEVITLTILIVLLALILYYIKWSLSYWERKGLESVCLNSRSKFNDVYVKFKSKGLKHCGIYALTKPMYVPIDLDIIRCILQTNFDHFVNHVSYVNEKNDPLSVTLFNLSDDKWRNMRVKLTPTFTSGKMKMMFKTMMECAPTLIEAIRNKSEGGEPVNIKDVTERFNINLIGSCAFGIECDALNKPDCGFQKYGKEVSEASWRKTTAALIPKRLLDLVGFRTNSKETENFFMDVVKEIVNYREANNVYRQDFMHMMLQLRNRDKITDDDQITENNQKGSFMKFRQVTAMCFTFFTGFEGSSTLISFALLELSLNQDIQSKLRAEIENVIKNHEKVTYDAIMEMSYLHQVVTETLRKHSPALGTTRLCTKDFQIPNTNVVIEKGTQVIIPVFAVQRDPEIYPDPERFDPDRFLPENKNKRHPLAFLAFGEGPRMCIGSRFAFLQAKVGLVTILRNFRVEMNTRTKTPIEYDEKRLLTAVKGDVWLDFFNLNS